MDNKFNMSKEHLFPILLVLLYMHFREAPQHVVVLESVWGNCSIMMPCRHFLANLQV